MPLSQTEALCRDLFHRMGYENPIRSEYLALARLECQDRASDGVIVPHRNSPVTTSRTMTLRVPGLLLLGAEKTATSPRMPWKVSSSAVCWAAVRALMLCFSLRLIPYASL